MGKFTVLAGAILVLGVIIPSGSAFAEVIIDDFDLGNQFIFSTTVGSTSANYATASTALGGNRYSEVTLQVGGSASLQVTASGSEVLDIANSGSSRGWHAVSYGWNGSSQSDSNWDFSKEVVFELDVTSVDSGTGGGSGGNLVITVWNGASSFSSSSSPWPTTTGTWRVPFTTFSGSPNWSAIDRMEFKFTATNLSPDITLDIIRAVPEPATALLLLLGGALCGVSAWRRRRSK